MANKSYLVEITPLGNYYFGGENTFSTTDKATNNAAVTNYLVRSRQYPQQSALLGLLRYFVLVKENAMKCPAEGLIGKTGFKGQEEIGEEKAPDTWGLIKSISPLMIKKGNDCYLPAGEDYQFYFDNKENKEKLTKLEQSEHTSIRYSFGKHGSMYYDNFDPKHIAEMLWRRIGSVGCLEEDFLRPGAIFTKSFQVGINKPRQGESNEDAFYKQYYFRLNKGFSFAVLLETEPEIKDACIPLVVPFGADQGLFSIRLHDREEKFFPKQDYNPGIVKITLISDAYCNFGILDDCLLAITHGVDFRYIKTNILTRRYYNKGNKAGDMDKSAKLNLLGRGSVLYTNEPEKIVDELENKYPAYRNAGFNYYIIEQINQ